MKALASLIVTTYNWPQSLRLVLLSLEQQTNRQFEVIVADDGSTDETRNMIEELRGSIRYPLHHVWQEDLGFRAAGCRNKAVLKSTADYLVFLDGDCIVREDFVEQHLRLSESGWYVRGNRIKLSEDYTRRLLASQSLDGLTDGRRLFEHRRRGDFKRILPLLRLPLGVMRYYKKEEWYGVKTCNMGVARDDFYAVNGFNEDFEGWGHEDADLAIRLIRNGVLRKEGIFATTVFHCYHHELDRSDEAGNRKMLAQSFEGDIVVANGLIKPA